MPPAVEPAQPPIKLNRISNTGNAPGHQANPSEVVARGGNDGH